MLSARTSIAAPIGNSMIHSSSRPAPSRRSKNSDTAAKTASTTAIPVRSSHPPCSSIRHTAALATSMRIPNPAQTGTRSVFHRLSI